MLNNIYLSPNRTDNPMRDVFALITDRRTLFILESLYSVDCDAGTLRNKTRKMLSHRQYYSRISKLLRTDLVTRHGSSYHITSFGKILLQLQLWSQRAFNNYWKLKMIDSLTDLSEKELESFINGVVTDPQIRSMLRSTTITTTTEHQSTPYKEESTNFLLGTESELDWPHYNIMLVDDDRDTLMTFKTVLESYNLRVRTFDSSYDALKEFLNIEPHTYDLVVLDIRMPGLNGLQLYQRIRAIDDRVKVLFLSALSLREELVSVLPDMSLNNVIGKPISSSDFVEKVTRELRGLRNKINDQQINSNLPPQLLR